MWNPFKKKKKETIPKRWTTPKIEKVKRKRGRPRKKKPDVVEQVVTEALPTSRVNVKPSFKFRIPYLLKIKRFTAAILFIFNLFVAQATLTSAPASQPLYILFGLNALIFLDYLWKTRRKTIEREKLNEAWDKA